MSLPPPAPSPFPPPPPSVDAPTSRRQYGPWGWLLLVTLAVGLITGVVAAVASAVDFADRVDDLVRVETPGQTTVTLSAGDQVIYAEYPGANCTGVSRDADGDRHGCPEVPRPDVDFSVRGPNEREVRLGSYGSSVTYSLLGHDGRAINTIDVPAEGTYTITSTGDPIVLAIGPSVGRSIVRLVIGILVAAFCFVGLIITGVVMIVRRARRRGTR